MVDALAREAGREGTAGTGPYIQTDSYSTPLYVVGAHQPVVRVALKDPHARWREEPAASLQKGPNPGSRAACHGQRRAHDRVATVA